MSAALPAALGACLALLLIAAAGRGLHGRQVARRVGALERPGTSSALAAPSPDHDAARWLHPRWLRRWRRAPPVDWAGTLEAVARSVRTGSSLSGALAGSDGHATPRLRRAIQRHAVGVPLVEALASDDHRSFDAARGRTRRGAEGAGSSAAGDRAADEAFALAALQVAATIGGNVAATLDRAGTTLRERRAIRDDRAVHSAQARMSARVLSALPVAFAIWCVSTDGHVASFLLSSPAGWGCLAAGAALNLAGWWWMRRTIGSVGGSS